MSYKMCISKGRAGRVKPGDAIEDFERPRFGFYWWFWFPRIFWNGGRFSRKECVDISFQWLCFWFGIIFFGGRQSRDTGVERDA